MTACGNKNYKVGLILFSIGEGLAILEAIGLLIYDIILNYNDKLYGYANWQTIIYIAVSVLLTAAVIIFAALTKKSAEEKQTKIFSILLMIFSGVAILYGIYGVLNNIMTDMSYYYFTEISEIISYAARQLLLLIVSGNGFIIIGAAILIFFGFKKRQVN